MHNARQILYPHSIFVWSFIDRTDNTVKVCVFLIVVFKCNISQVFGLTAVQEKEEEEIAQLNWITTTQHRVQYTSISFSTQLKKADLLVPVTAIQN
jgi:hypothetical protein